MTRQEHKQQVVARLVSACTELEHALKLSASNARYDPLVIPQAMRNELSGMVNDLDRMLGQLTAI